ncbi:MAG: TetR/AcrR family transcriptional regulator [Vicinamibacterales bacterium]
MFTKSQAPAGRQARKAATRARVLDAARAILERVGFEATGIRDVARAAGVAPGTVLLHFRDKQDLLHAALFDDLQRTWTAARSAARRRSLRADLTHLAQAFFDYYARRPVLSRTLLRESLFAAPPWSGQFAGQVAEVHAHVAGLVAAARARGELVPAADPALVAGAFVAFYYLALLAWLQGGAAEPLRVFAPLLAQHLDGLRPAAARARSPRR